MKLPTTLKIGAFIAIPLFADKPSHSSVPLDRQEAVAQSGGQGRPIGRRFCVLPWTAASTAANFVKADRKLFCAVAILSVLLMLDGAARTEPAIKCRHPQRPSSADRIASFISEASTRFGIPMQWIRAVMGVESSNNQHATSPKGAMGLMQIMPETYSDLRARHGLGSNPYDPHDNILAGTAYLREMHDLYGSPGFLAAYNAGPLRYEDHLTTGRPLPAETRAYVATLAFQLGLKQTDDGARAFSSAGNRPALSPAPIFVEQLENVFTSIQSAFGAPSERNSTTSSVADLSALEPAAHGLSARKSAAASLFISRSQEGLRQHKI